MVEDRVSGDKESYTNFHNSMSAFLGNYRRILGAVETGVLPGSRAKELVQLDYAAVRSQPYLRETTTPIISSMENLLVEETEIMCLDAIDLAVERPDPARTDHKTITHNYKTRLRLEEEAKEDKKRERRENILNAIYTTGTFTLSTAAAYGTQAGLIDGKVLSSLVFGVPAVMLLAHGINRIMPPVREIKKKTGDYAGKVGRATGLLSVMGLLGFMSGNLPREKEDIMYPHRVMEISEQGPGFFVETGDVPQYKSR